MENHEWRDLIGRASAQRRGAIRGTTFLKAWGSASRPVLVLADDGCEYVVKGRQNGRMIFNDHVVALLGERMAAPVAATAVVDLPPDLITMQPELQHMAPGETHATRWLPGCTDREGIQQVNLAENRSRFAALAVLYGWIVANDHQFIYATAVPNLVHSVDHGHFFPGGPAWTVESLSGASAAAPDAQLVSACALSPPELTVAAKGLARVTDEAVAAAVGATPADWGAITTNEKIALAEFLAGRRDHLVSSLMVN